MNQVRIHPNSLRPDPNPAEANPLSSCWRISLPLTSSASANVSDSLLASATPCWRHRLREPNPTARVTIHLSRTIHSGSIWVVLFQSQHNCSPNLFEFRFKFCQKCWICSWVSYWKEFTAFEQQIWLLQVRVWCRYCSCSKTSVF